MTLDNLGIYGSRQIERRYYWTKEGALNFKMPGTYSVRMKGALKDSEGKLPEVPFESPEAVILIEERYMSLSELRELSQNLLESEIKKTSADIIWRIVEIQGKNRVSSTRVSPQYFSETQIPKEARKNHESYWGTTFYYTFSPEGILLSWCKTPFYVIID